MEEPSVKSKRKKYERKLKDPRLLAISDTLRKVWNPIGLWEEDPKDEYDSYAPRVSDLLQKYEDVEMEAVAHIASYLTWVRVHKIGLDRIQGCDKDAHAACVLVSKRFTY